MEFSLSGTRPLGIAMAAIGLIGLAFVLPEEKSLEPREIGSAANGTNAKIIARIGKVGFSNGNAFMELEGPPTVRAVYFRPGSEQAAVLRQGAAVRVHGKISEYLGRKEIIVEKVVKID